MRTSLPLALLFVMTVPILAQPAEHPQVPLVPPEVPKHRQDQIWAAAPEQARVTPEGPRRVLIFDTPFMDKSPHARWGIPFATYAMQAIGVKTGAFEPVPSDDIALFLPDNIKQFDAILLNNSDGPWIRPTDEDMDRLKEFGADADEVEQLLRRSFLDYVSNGGGLVAYHFAIGANNHWPEYKELLGAGYWGHPWNEEVGIKVEEPDHPLVQAFGGDDLRLTEEVFQFRDPYSRDKVRVLLSLDVENTNMGVQWIERTDNDFALAWVKEHGEGRVFYTAIGHRTEHFWNPTLLQFYLDAIQFATGDLQAPAEPRPAPEKAADG